MIVGFVSDSQFSPVCAVLRRAGSRCRYCQYYISSCTMERTIFCFRWVWVIIRVLESPFSLCEKAICDFARNSCSFSTSLNCVIACVTTIQMATIWLHGETLPIIYRTTKNPHVCALMCLCHMQTLSNATKYINEDKRKTKMMKFIHHLGNVFDIIFDKYAWP